MKAKSIKGKSTEEIQTAFILHHQTTGSGTGLGLSLAYDIITKGHGGELKVETEEGKGAEFKIILPVV